MIKLTLYIILLLSFSLTSYGKDPKVIIATVQLDKTLKENNDLRIMLLTTIRGYSFLDQVSLIKVDRKIKKLYKKKEKLDIEDAIKVSKELKLDVAIVLYSEKKLIPATNGTVTNGTVTNGTVTNGTVTNGTMPNGTMPNGTMPNGTVTNGTVTNGTVTNGTMTNGTVTNGTMPNGAVTNGAMTNGAMTNWAMTNWAMTNWVMTNGDITNWAMTNGDITNGTTTNDTTTNGTTTNGTTTNGTVTNEMFETIYFIQGINIETEETIYSNKTSNVSEVSTFTREIINIVGINYSRDMLGKIESPSNDIDLQFSINIINDKDNKINLTNNSDIYVSDKLEFNFTVNKDGFITIIGFLNNDSILLLNPNDFSKITNVVSNENYTIPSKDALFDIIASGSKGVDEYFIIFTEDKPDFVSDTKYVNGTGFKNINYSNITEYSKLIKNTLEKEKNWHIQKIKLNLNELLFIKEDEIAEGGVYEEYY